MPTSSDGQVRGLSFSGYFRGRVVNNVDPKGEARLGVFIPSLITEVPNNLEAPKPTTAAIPPTLFANQHELGLSTQVKRDNYIWARPAAHLVENGSASSNASGSYKVPAVGTMVIVYFEAEDVNKPYWLPFSPTVTGDVIAGANIGKGLNVDTAAANWKDPAKKVNMHILAEQPNGNVMYMDSNADTNAFVLRWANGHTVSVGHATESGIVLQTEKGHKVQLDENSTEIRVQTHTGQVRVVLSDSGDITITNTGNTTINTTGTTNITAQGGVNISSGGGSPTVVKSTGPMTVMSPKISLKGG
jgi:uncharacterized protein involved in type VI secretion and phage assembly